MFRVKPIVEASPRSEREPPVPPDRAEDLRLARRVVAGEAEAWRRFVEHYAGLLYTVVRRHLHSRDDDDVRSIFVDVLVALRRDKLRRYEGRAALSTWLTLVARNETLDALRRRYGRGRETKLSRLTPDERTVFRMYYLESCSPREILRSLERRGEPWSLDRLLEVLRDIERRLGEGWLRRLAYDLRAQTVGVSSGRLLEYLDHVRDEFLQQPGSHAPDYYLMEREARRTAGELMEVVATLEPREQRMLHLRFERGWTARRIASELGLEDPRGVYRHLARLVRRLRVLVGQAPEEEP